MRQESPLVFIERDYLTRLVNDSSYSFLFLLIAFRSAPCTHFVT